MKRYTLITVLLLFYVFTICAQDNDTIYFMKNNKIVNLQSLGATDIDSMVFSGNIQMIPVLIREKNLAKIHL